MENIKEDSEEDKTFIQSTNNGKHKGRVLMWAYDLLSESNDLRKMGTWNKKKYELNVHWKHLSYHFCL